MNLLSKPTANCRNRYTKLVYECEFIYLLKVRSTQNRESTKGIKVLSTTHLGIWRGKNTFSNKQMFADCRN